MKRIIANTNNVSCSLKSWIIPDVSIRRSAPRNRDSSIAIVSTKTNKLSTLLKMCFLVIITLTFLYDKFSVDARRQKVTLQQTTASLLQQSRCSKIVV